MARVQRKVPAKVEDLAAAHNDLKDFLVAQLRLLAVDFGCHNDRSERTIASDNAADLATSLVLANEIKAVYGFHIADTMAHKAADSENELAEPAASDLTTAIALANEIKAAYNLHRADTDFHYGADATNVTAAADATDLASLLTLLNELKTDINAHMASGPVCKSTRVVSA